MKKTIIIPMFTVLLTWTFVSCGNENDLPDVKNAEFANNISVENKTLQDLRLYNQSIATKTETRSFWGGLRRLAKAVVADVIGSGKGAVRGFHAEPGGFSVDIIPVITNAVSRSKKAYQELAYETTSDDLDRSLCRGLISFCTNKIHPEQTDSLASLDSIIFAPNTISITNDSLYAQILLPSSLEELKKVGVAHNYIIRHHYLSVLGEVDPFSNGHEPDIEDPIGGDQYIQALAEEIGNDYYCISLNTGLYCNINGFDYETYMIEEPFDSQNVQQTISMLLDALVNSVSNPSDVMDLVNGYITIIENNNDFSLEQKTQVYAALVTAVYSYNLWYNRYMEINPMPIHM